MEDHELMTEQFEAHRSHLRAVAYRMLGSASEADDAVQEAWLRFSRSDTSDVDNLGAWLRTVVGRVCLDMLRARRSRREEPWGIHVPEPVASHQSGADPEQEALLADSVGLALLVVMDRLTPSERVAFVLHDLFAVPFGEIAAIVGGSPSAAKMRATRARHRVRKTSPVPDPDHNHQREVVEAFLAASRNGDINALLAVLAPDVVVRADAAATPTGTPRQARGAQAVARQALSFAARAQFARPALVDGAVGVVVAALGHLSTVMIFKVSGRWIVAVDVLADPDRLRQLDLAVLDDPPGR